MTPPTIAITLLVQIEQGVAWLAVRPFVEHPWDLNRVYNLSVSLIHLSEDQIYKNLLYKALNVRIRVFDTLSSEFAFSSLRDVWFSVLLLSPFIYLFE